MHHYGSERRRSADTMKDENEVKMRNHSISINIFTFQIKNDNLIT